jgi:hypothetical protein
VVDDPPPAAVVVTCSGSRVLVVSPSGVVVTVGSVGGTVGSVGGTVGSVGGTVGVGVKPVTDHPLKFDPTSSMPGLEKLWSNLRFPPPAQMSTV